MARARQLVRSSGYYVATPRAHVSVVAGMDDLEYDDPRWRDIKERLIREARTNFAAFYRKASPEEAKILDSLVMSRHVFKHLSATPRQFLVPDIRQALERQNHHAEQVFIQLVAVVRASQSFSGLSSADAAEMEQNLFDPHLTAGE